MMRKTFFAGKLSVKDKPVGEMNEKSNVIVLGFRSFQDMLDK